MSLNTAHEGYEYQDLLTAYFILKEILNENDSVFKIDKKEHTKDKFDDLTIKNSNGVFKKQIKYSNEIINHTATKNDFANSNTYDLAFYDLFHSWNHNRNHDYRICLAWNEPTDKLKGFLKISSKPKTFDNNLTNIFEIDIDKLWPNGKEPENSWQKFKTESSNINRSDFSIFCNALAIEMNFPKQGSGTTFTGELEQVIIKQIQNLGIGDYPNDYYNPNSFALELLKLITRSRSKGLEIKASDIFSKFNIITNFGSIEQVFPIIFEKNISTENNINSFIEQIELDNKIILQGEPGSGKSWFIQNLQTALKNIGYNVVKHYCYTELKDKFSRERITLNAFFGNLIKEIIDTFPSLKEVKKHRYTSNLEELNILLTHIDRETIIIIDGLDHIDRIFLFNQTELTLNDIAIVKAINNLQFSEKVKILVVSQPIEELNKLSDYKILNLPKWRENEVLDYFSKNNITDVSLEDERKLSELLTEKCDGNPLYLNYLIEELNDLSKISIDTINSLPPYSYNLEDYYEYLIKKLNYDSIVPQVLSGANFSLTKNEIIEITHQGKKVEKSLSILKPILSGKLTNSGFMIYHESFRRFILEKLKDDDVDIEYAVFRPLIEWFDKKGFFQFTKAYYFYFQLLYGIGDFERILNYLKPEFITESIYHGHSFEAVKRNYYYLAKSAVYQKELPQIIIVNELNKVLSFTEDQYYNNLHLYFSALGHLKGFKLVSDYLVFDGKPTLPKLAGLKICYLCDQNNEPAPWDLYFDYFEGGKEISRDDFHYYIRKLIIYRETEHLIKIATKINNSYEDYIPIFVNELRAYNDKDYINELQETNQIFIELGKYEKGFETTEKDLYALAEELLDLESVYDTEVLIIKSFFHQIEVNIKNQDAIAKIIKSFKGKNWFYNWVIYYIKIKLIQLSPVQKGNYEFSKVFDAFQFLIYDTEPFKGKLSADKLYSLRGYIFNSLSEGVKLLNTKTEWQKIIEVLVKLSDETTTHIRKNIGGPLATDMLFYLLNGNSNDINRPEIIKVFSQLINEKAEYQLHSNLADYCFILSEQYSLNQNFDQADKFFQKGLNFFFGYTIRRDRTLEDVIYSVENYAQVNAINSNKYIKKIKSLVDSVTNHTDGKDTYRFPVEWYEKYLKINFKEAALYLLSQIKEGYYWVYEDQLRELLLCSNGKVYPNIEMFLFLTFPIESSEEFLNYGLNLVEKNKLKNHHLAKILIDNISEKPFDSKGDGTGYNDLFAERLSNIFNEFSLTDFNVKEGLTIRKKYSNEIINTDYISRKSFSDMSVVEVREYFSENIVKEIDLVSLFYYFDNLKVLTQKLKNLIDLIARKLEQYPKDAGFDLSVIFGEKNDVSAYYWVSKFVHEKDGWYNNFQNPKAFEKAYSMNPIIAVNSLISQTEKFTDLGVNNRCISSGLINCLVKVGYDKEIIEEMWTNLYDATAFRLPEQETIDWDEILSDELNLNIEEIFVCLLFTRFNSNITERHHWVLSGICFLYENHPEIMIKPTKWFFQNKNIFLTTNLILVLEILLDINESNKEYAQLFESELNNLVPSKYYFINAIIRQILGKETLMNPNVSQVQFTASSKDVETFCQVNYRNNIINNQNFNFETVVGKYTNSIAKEYGNCFKFLGNRMLNRYVTNIYPANYQFELLNTELYGEFENYTNQSDLHHLLHIDYKTIVAQTQSFIKRPNIPKPSQIKTAWERNEIREDDWIRLSFYEKELYENEDSKNKECCVYESVVFNSNLDKSFPFLNIAFYPIHIWEGFEMIYLDAFLGVSLIQEYDTLEDYKILWINPFFISKLNLHVDNYLNGLNAKNEKGETILKYNQWSSNYIGNRTITDEIPKLSGAELLCRKDYFDKICNFFSPEKPYSYRLKIE